jgi:photosystem II stability/assembly factor-like uncharacterized protein
MRLCRPVLATLMFVSGCNGGGNVASVVITPMTAHVAVGGTARLQAQARNASQAPVSTTFTWTSDKPAIAAVDSGGTVTGVIDGVANITATAPNGVKGSAVVQVGTGGGDVLTITMTGGGMGTVTSSPSGIDCGSTCAWGFSAGTMVTLTPKPASGSYFRGWSGACSGTGPCTVTMDMDQQATAEFDLGAGPTLTVAIMGSGTGTVTSSPAGINCTSGATSGCSGVFPSGTQVTLSATAATGQFLGWSGGGCSGTGPCVITLTADTQVTASIAMTRTLTVTLAGDGNGTVTSTPPGISCASGSASGCSFAFPDTIAMVTLSASPAMGSSWAGWSVGGGGAPGCTAASTSCPFVPGMTAIASFSSWSLRRPFPSRLGNIIYLGLASGTLIALGSDGKLATAAESIPTTWSSVAMTTSAGLRGAISCTMQAGEIAVAVGDGGAIMTSSGGTSWSAATSPTTNNLRAVTCDSSVSPNELVAVGDSGTILRSSDGSSWSVVNVAGVTQNLTGVDSYSGVIGAVGAGGTLLTSGDHGATWSTQASGTTQPLNGVSLRSGKFVAVGNAATVVQATNTQNTAWSVSTPAAAGGQDLTSVDASGLQLIVSTALTNGTGEQQFMTAPVTTLSPWTAVTSTGTQEHFAIESRGHIFAVGDAGSILLTMDNGATWSYVLAPGGTSNGQAHTSLSGLAYGGSTFISVGNFGAVFSSSDGASWVSLRAGTAYDNNSAVAFGNGTFVAAGSTSASVARALVSTDNGFSWNPATAAFPSGELSSIIYGAGKGFIGVGYQAGAGTIKPLVATSSTGATGSWTIQPGTNLSGAINSVAFDGTTFVVTGGTSIYTSTDMITWTANTTTAGMGDTLGAVAFGSNAGGHAFVVLDVTHPEATLTSPDGGTWTRHAAAQAVHNNAVSNGFAFGNGVFLTNTLAQSADGVSWTYGALPVGGSIQGAVYVSGKGWVTSGAFETFLTHP